MKPGSLADIREHIENLTAALRLFERRQVDRAIVLDDVFEVGKHIEEAVALLVESDATGVWGNHELGLCSARLLNSDRGTMRPSQLFRRARTKP